MKRNPDIIIKYAENRKFFQENNPWAMEEMGRRLLEAEQRGLWKADPEVLDALKNLYLALQSVAEIRG
ncbi:MAG: cobaltochelatase subunit CobN [Methanothrix sp.]|jgi:cobaltochelatase CobN